MEFTGNKRTWLNSCVLLFLKENPSLKSASLKVRIKQ